MKLLRIIRAACVWSAVCCVLCTAVCYVYGTAVSGEAVSEKRRTYVPCIM